MQSLSIIDQVEFYRCLYDGVGGGGGTNLTPNITFKLGEFTKEGSIEIQPRMKMILTCNIFLNCLVRNRKLKVKFTKIVA